MYLRGFFSIQDTIRALQNRVVPYLRRPKGGDYFMFGILTTRQEHWSHARAAGFRLQPGTGFSYGRGQFRMAMFCHVQVSIPETGHTGLTRQRLLHGLDWLRQKKAAPVLVPETLRQQALEWGLEPVCRKAALEACASQAAVQAAAALGLSLRQVCLCVCGDPLSELAQTQLLSLAFSAGALRLCGPATHSALRSRLWRSCGVVPEGPIPADLTPITLLFSGGQPLSSALTVDFTDEDNRKDARFWHPSLLPPEGAVSVMPENTDPESFAAILWQCGAIPAREIRVMHLDIRPADPYNNRIGDRSDFCTIQDTGGTFHAETIQIDR